LLKEQADDQRQSHEDYQIVGKIPDQVLSNSFCPVTAAGGDGKAGSVDELGPGTKVEISEPVVLDGGRLSRRS